MVLLEVEVVRTRGTPLTERDVHLLGGPEHLRGLRPRGGGGARL